MSSQSGRVDTLDGLNPNGYISSADIPEETDELVVVQALSEQLDEPIGTIVVKSVFDTYFPPKLKGIIDSDSFKVRIVYHAPLPNPLGEDQSNFNRKFHFSPYSLLNPSSNPLPP